jgi:hypothetical protein
MALEKITKKQFIEDLQGATSYLVISTTENTLKAMVGFSNGVTDLDAYAQKQGDAYTKELLPRKVNKATASKIKFEYLKGGYSEVRLLPNSEYLKNGNYLYLVEPNGFIIAYYLV